jgi:tetratricopeptide (TPR) repeat protein
MLWSTISGDRDRAVGREPSTANDGCVPLSASTAGPERACMLALIFWLGCQLPGSVPRALEMARDGNLEAARVSLEQQRERHPRSVEVHIALGEVYYRIARDTLDRERNEARYLAFFDRAMDEFVTASELDPTHDRPHFFLAVIDVYRGDIDSAYIGFQNTRRLKPDGIAYSNLAETFVYRGDPQMARRWNLRALQLGAGTGPVTFNQMLIHWAEGDLDAARRDFRDLKLHYPELLHEINVARIPLAPNRFEHFAQYCCDSPACGPYLKDACTDLGFPVRHRELSHEAIRKELRIEIEKRRRLREVYEQRKELEIEIVDPEVTSP